jgi:DNA-binding NarL/FixJ family response regulator
MIRTLIVDDQPLVRAGLQSIFQHVEDIAVVGEASDGRSALQLARTERPDVILMDIRMPIVDGLEATRMITNDPDLADVRVLILTTFDLDEYVYAALQAGASGFLLKDAPPERIFDAVRVITAGEALLAPTATRRLIESFLDQQTTARPDAVRQMATLTDREREVLALVGRGMSNAEISDQLVVSEATTKTHISRAMTKLAARDRAQLVVLAYEGGLVHPGRH